MPFKIFEQWAIQPPTVAVGMPNDKRAKLPMKTITRIIKALGVVSLTLFGALIVYANWETPPMHARVKPVKFVIYEVSGIPDSLSARQLENTLARTPGVSAAVINHRAKLMSLSFHEDEVSEQTLRHIATDQDTYQLSTPEYGNVEASGPQCPIPMSYILAFERIKYALCFR